MPAHYTDDVPASQRVKTSSRLWSVEVAMADASGVMDFAGPGASGLDKLVDERQSVNYEFANGRTFKQPRNPYA
jgi:hypothetical protein